MRLLMISHSLNYWTGPYARFLMDRGHAVRVVSFSPDPLDGVEMDYVGIDPWRENKKAYLTRVPRVRRIVREFKPDVVLASYVLSNGLTAALSWRGPLMLSAHGGDILEQEGRTGWRLWLWDRLVRFICRRGNLIHTVSDEMDERMLAIGVPAGNIVQIPVGIEVERFYPAEGMPHAECTRLLCVRRHEPVYDNMTIIEALGRLKKAGRAFSCTFAGEGALLAKHKNRVRELGLDDQVTFTGNLLPEEMPALVRSADVYISASLGDGTSSALLEGMASGLFPVVTRIPANIPWIDEGRTGLMFGVGNVEELSTQLLRVLDEPELARQAFSLNRERVLKDGSLKTNMRRFAEALETLAPSSRP